MKVTTDVTVVKETTDKDKKRGRDVEGGKGKRERERERERERGMYQTRSLAGGYR